MAIIKCKMCGGELVLAEDSSTATCEYCGSVQTVPKADDEKKLIQFERAERLRKACEFDKAAGIYETIVADFRQEAEAYWGLVLCKFGIEYVDDPATGKKIPTCHRSSFDSIMEDSDFEQALENADVNARRVYRDEAKAIEEIRKGIIAVSSNEEPYDIFICYKETAEDGQRTLDSVLAQDVYDALTDKGYRVFFSRITLEDKLGVEYEPYIFAALNSAKVMLTFGTDFEYFNAVWVKNEWSRFLKLMAKDKDKHLIPCYKGIDAYDMPKEFAKLQAQDLGKVGAIQDLLRGIEKLLPRQTETQTIIQERVVIGGSGDNKIASLLDRGNMALEDGDWAKADSFFEDVLNNDSKNAQAYLGKALAQEKCRTLDAFIRKRKDATQTAKAEKRYIQSNKSHIAEMTKKFAIPVYLPNDGIETVYYFDLSYDSYLPDRRQQVKSEQIFWETHKLLSRAEQFATGAVAENLKSAKQTLFTVLEDRIKKEEAADAAAAQQLAARYADFLKKADEKVQALHTKQLAIRDADYEAFKRILNTATTPGQLTEAVRKYKHLGGFKDTDALIEQCHQRAKELQLQLDAQAKKQWLEQEKQKEQQAARTKRIIIICGIFAALILLAFILWKTVVVPMQTYNTGVQLMEEGKYTQAINAFHLHPDYKDSSEKISQCLDAMALANKAEQYITAKNYLDGGNYQAALTMFQKLGDYMDSAQMAEQCQVGIYEDAYTAAKKLLEENSYKKALTAFETLGDFKDSKEIAAEIVRQQDVIEQAKALLMVSPVDLDAFDALLQTLPEDGEVAVERLQVSHYRELVQLYRPFCGSFKIISGNRSALDACCTYPTNRTTDQDLTLIPSYSENGGSPRWYINLTYKTKKGEFYGVPISFKADLGTNHFALTSLTTGNYDLWINESGNLVVNYYKQSKLVSSCVLQKVESNQ